MASSLEAEKFRLHLASVYINDAIRGRKIPGKELTSSAQLSWYHLYARLWALFRVHSHRRCSFHSRAWFVFFCTINVLHCLVILIENPNSLGVDAGVAIGAVELFDCLVIAADLWVLSRFQRLWRHSWNVFRFAMLAATLLDVILFMSGLYVCRWSRFLRPFLLVRS